jgi:iron complex outermembrane recepter protein
MRTNLRQQLLATTLLVGAFAYSNPALAQQAPPPDQPPTQNATSQPPSGPVEAQPTPAVSAQGQPTTAPQEIIITGSRIAQPNLTSAAPVTVVSDQDVKLAGSTRIEDVLNQLPSVGAAQASGQSNGATGTAEVDLRALGSKRTLVLINGRRLLPGDPNAPLGNEAADINNIPAALIKRVEVLTGGASSVYGADAVAGVVNFIMDTNFEGVRFDGNWSVYQHNNDNPSVGGGLSMADILNAKAFPFPSGSVTDGRSIDGTVTIGAGFDDGRGHVVAYFGYRKVNPILESERDYSACVIQDSTTGVPRCGGSATAAPGTGVIFSGGTSTLAALGPGTITVGAQNTFNFGPLNYFQRPDKRFIGGAFANYEINDAVKPYLEFMFMDDRSLAQIAPSGDFGNTQTINCDNPLMSAAQRAVICAPENLVNGFLGSFPLAVGAPFNPNPGAPPLEIIDPTTGVAHNIAFFQLLRRNVEGGNRIADLRHQSWRGVVGTRGDLSNVFSYDSYFQVGHTNYTQVYKNEFSVSRLTRALDVVTDPATGQPVCRSFLSGLDPTCVPYDPFGTAPSAAAVNFLNVFGVIQGVTTEQIGHADVTANLGEAGWKTPWAEDGVGVNVGVEWRREGLDLNPDESFQSNDLAGQGAPTLPNSGNFHVWEFFGETQIPIIQHSFIDDLTFSAGYRRSSYSTSGGNKFKTDTWKVALEFAPVSDIRFRGALNRAVRAPNIEELFAPDFVGLLGTKDPCTGHVIAADEFGCIASGLAVGRQTPGNPAAQYNALLGGVPTLQPEIATTKTLGVVLQPRFIPRFAVTVDYFNIKIKDAIQGIGPDAIISACIADSTATFISPACDRIHRDAGGSLWLTSNGFIDNLPANTSTIKTDGVDFNATYSHRFFSLGNLSTSFIGTWLRHYKNDNGLTEPFDCAGLYGPVCSGTSVGSSAPLPKWRHKWRVGLDTNFGLGVSVQWRRVGKVTAETLIDNESLSGAPNQFEPGLHVPAQNYFDLAATYTLFDRVNLRAGVNNVFDRDPPLITSGNGNRPGSSLCPTGPCNGNTYPGTWDALGRLIWAGATIDFVPHHAPPPPPPPPAPPPPPPAAPATITCPDGLVILANEQCPAPPPPPPPPPPAPERGH